jgi:hypothetical protein
MTIGKEIPFRRSKHQRDTGSLVFDQERQAAHGESEGKPKPSKEPRERPDTEK